MKKSDDVIAREGLKILELIELLENDDDFEYDNDTVGFFELDPFEIDEMCDDVF
jgi:hypothetical protein